MEKIAIIFITDKIFKNPIYNPYIRRELQKLDLEIGECFIIDEFELSYIKKTKKRNILIITPTDIILENPKIESKNSTLYEIDKKNINILKVSIEKKLPSILLKGIEKEIYHYFPKDGGISDKMKIFTEREGVNITPVIDGWYQIETCKNITPPQERLIKSKSIIEALIQYLSSEKKSITFAESCTGGLLASYFTSQSGASNILKGSYITYSNEIKHKWLNVKNETLEKYGAVSTECVSEMAEGAKKNLSADISIAISGIAGPTGAVEGKPVGTVYLCIINESQKDIYRLQLQGDRNAIQEQTVYMALKRLIESEEKIFNFFSKNP